MRESRRHCHCEKRSDEAISFAMERTLRSSQLTVPTSRCPILRATPPPAREGAGRRRYGRGVVFSNWSIEWPRSSSFGDVFGGQSRVLMT